MGLSGVQTWICVLSICLSRIVVGQAVADPQYLVAIPAVIRSGAQTTLCASLLQPSEDMTMNVTLRPGGVLLLQTSNTDFHICETFQAPSVERNTVLNFHVKVQGGTFSSEEVRKVMVRVYQPRTFIQTDKPIYLPGQTVHFRVITLDPDLRSVNSRYNTIEIQDANRNRIGQWLDTESDGKMLQLSYSLNPEAPQGKYKIFVWINETKLSLDFKVEKYVLPKFEVKINSPDEISIADDTIPVEVCARYTFGHPVPGSVDLELCRPLLQHVASTMGDSLKAPCHQETRQTDKTGCTRFFVERSTFTEIDHKAVQKKISIKVRVEEEGTGVSYSEQKNMDLSYVIGKVSFIDTPSVYKAGMTLEGKIKVVFFNNTPIPDKAVSVIMSERRREHRLLGNITTNNDGIATFSINTTEHQLQIELKGSVEEPGLAPPARYQVAMHSISKIEEPSPDSKFVSSLKVDHFDTALLCDKDSDISIKYTIAGETQGFVNVMYLLLSRGSIITQGRRKVEVLSEPVTEGKVSFTLRVAPEMAPFVQVVAYAVLPSENVIAHSAAFSVEKCFSHKVSLEFSQISAVPGDETTLQVTANPESLCGLSIVDQSVLIKEPGKTLTADKIFSFLPVQKSSHFPYEVEDHVHCVRLRQRRRIRPRPGRNDDAFSVFKSVGLKMATNLMIKIPDCVAFRGEEYSRNYYGRHYLHSSRQGISFFQPLAVGLGHDNTRGDEVDSPVETVRTFFPETWLWKMVKVEKSGMADIPLTVPDTITTWETEAFCLSDQGFGLAPRQEITVFQPFFLELTLPYSIIRGEHFELKATVFNYLSSCIMVNVNPAPSSVYTLTSLSGDQHTFCLCASERKTISWTMLPSIIGVVNVTVSAEAVPSHISCDNEVVSVPDRGRIDTVTRSLIVKAEGTEIMKAHNWLFCPKGEAVTEEVELQLPENVIMGSVYASVSVLGDIMGRALQNIEGMLTMPYGCGEQNMARLAPNIYILEYLKSTQQLTKAIMEKASNFLTSGYQRQLNYKHDSGGYSTFGSGEENTWLTAFVLRSFAKARAFVFIDPAKILDSENFLKTRQLESGCFAQSGKLFHNKMKGGVSSDVTLSAYITAALLEMNASANHQVLQRSLFCLRASLVTMDNTYTAALMAYVFTLAGDMETRTQLLQRLDKVAVTEGNLLHWNQESTETSASLSVEISSYVILAKLSHSPSNEDLGYATRIVRWLIRQQNYFGGFYSTQDTVVALQALALYSTLTFSPQGSGTVMIQSPSSQLVFDVNQSNKLLYQEMELKDVAGKFSLNAQGSACVSVQVSLRYNIPTPTEVTTLSVEVNPDSVCNVQKPNLTLNLQSLYNGMESSTNMVILDIKMLSGFVPDPQSLQSLRGALQVNRVDQKDDHVIVYLGELPQNIPIFHTLDLIQEIPVQNLKPAIVKIYDYYQPSDQAETEYVFSCASA
ncbi:alpha-2-macroglobulin-like [Nelusetta ayraudi]|uniref:alpha-2-macroglobulin-like n=1 Tax=Nelusetta ayraudi TaxID=303726 RepID=UPI003F72D5B3